MNAFYILVRTVQNNYERTLNCKWPKAFLFSCDDISVYFSATAFMVKLNAVVNAHLKIFGYNLQNLKIVEN